VIASGVTVEQVGYTLNPGAEAPGWLGAVYPRLRQTQRTATHPGRTRSSPLPRSTSSTSWAVLIRRLAGLLPINGW